MKIIFLVCGFSGDIRAVYASLLFMKFWLFVLKLVGLEVATKVMVR
jgi:hypothetical protein